MNPAMEAVEAINSLESSAVSEITLRISNTIDHKMPVKCLCGSQA
jgi:hypothetical protein